MSIENSSNSSTFCPTAPYHATKSLIQNHIQICDQHIKFNQNTCLKLRYLSNSKIFVFRHFHCHIVVQPKVASKNKCHIRVQLINISQKNYKCRKKKSKNFYIFFSSLKNNFKFLRKVSKPLHSLIIFRALSKYIRVFVVA